MIRRAMKLRSELTRKLIAAGAGVSILFQLAPPANACAPDFPQAVMINGTHPDFPLKLFASGNVGVIQPGWAKSYLIVGYRYLNNQPLTPLEQRSVVRLWHSRLVKASMYNYQWGMDDLERYLDLRKKAVGEDPKREPTIYSSMDSYRYHQQIGNSAFAAAWKTLSDRIKRYGLKSRQVREWIKAQDIVFGVSSQKVKIPAALGAGFDELMKADRQYQIAAATFYAKDLVKAAQLFQKIAAEPGSPWRTLASYMVARSKANTALTTADQKDIDDANIYIKTSLAQTKDEVIREDLFDLLRPISYIANPAALQGLVDLISRPGSPRFGGDVGDITFLVEESSSPSEQSGSERKTEQTNASAQPDLVDWLTTVQQRDDDYSYYSEDEQKKFREEQARDARHAVEKWRETKAIHWLVAAVSLNSLRDSAMKDLYDAASAVRSVSPAFLTCKYYVIDALIGAAKLDEARRQALAILAMKNLPTSTRNLFSTQMLPLCRTADEYLRFAIQAPPEIANDGNLLPRNFLWLEKATTAYAEPPTFDAPVAEDMNKNLPLKFWVKLAANRTLHPRLRALLLRATWLRAQLLDKPEVAASLENDLAATTPLLAPFLQAYRSATTPDAKRFALSKLVLRFYGMSPYIDGGVERHGLALNEFDYYNANFWLPLQLSGARPEEQYSYYAPGVFAGSERIRNMVKEYSNPGLVRILDNLDKKAAEQERRKIWDNHPSRFLGEPVLRWAATHPRDPAIPQLLYHLNRLPKWTGVTKTGSEYSKKAYLQLHSKYPNNPWTDRAVCWY